MVMDETTRKYLAEIGRRGGMVRSPAKLEANKRNAKRPRPTARGPRKARVVPVVAVVEGAGPAV